MWYCREKWTNIRALQWAPLDSETSGDVNERLYLKKKIKKNSLCDREGKVEIRAEIKPVKMRYAGSGENLFSPIVHLKRSCKIKESERTGSGGQLQWGCSALMWREESAQPRRRAGQFECAPRGAPAESRGESSFLSLCLALSLYLSLCFLSLTLSPPSSVPLAVFHRWGRGAKADPPLSPFWVRQSSEPWRFYYIWAVVHWVVRVRKQCSLCCPGVLDQWHMKLMMLPLSYRVGSSFHFVTQKKPNKQKTGLILRWTMNM